MTDQSIDNLIAAFDNWRSNKQYRSERIPESLLKRARELTPALGVGAVAARLGIHTDNLCAARELKQKSGKLSSTVKTPSFSRLDIIKPVTTSFVAEVEIPNGVKLRIFTITPETMTLVSAFSGRAQL